MFDNHIHVGIFKDLYFSSKKVAKDMKDLHIEKYFFSSTSTGDVPFKQVQYEIDELIELSEGKAEPYLWVSPDMIQNHKDLKPYFYRDFAGIKIHGLQNWEIFSDEKPLRRVFSIAREKNLPVLLHTGEHEICRPKVYKNICADFHDLKIILAHSRPVDETVDVMKDCPNVFCDTAFTSEENILKLISENLTERIFWGTDLPVMEYFFPIPATEYYKNRISSVRKIIGEENFTKITHDNFINLLH